jgi:hypothetical protein
MKRLILVSLAVVLTAFAGCRTGNYKFDKDIYAAMPGLLMADPDVKAKIAYNEDGTPKVTFDKGEMFLTLADRLDEDTRNIIAGKAFQIFHDQYINDPAVKKPDGSYRRDKIGLRIFVGDTELYVLEWKLGEEKPQVISNRYGYFI